MNYFDLINACLIELNCKKQPSFEMLTKSDHDKIKNLLNRVNSEICTSDDWWFRERKTQFNISASQIENSNTIQGKITGIIIDNAEYAYDYDYERFYNNTYRARTYSLFNNTILFPPFENSKTATVFYLTNNFAKAENGTEKISMSLESDSSIIPEIFQEAVLVYGTCMRFKAMPNNPKYQHWLNEYTQAVKNIRSRIIRTASESPEVVINNSGGFKSGLLSVKNQNFF